MSGVRVGDRLGHLLKLRDRINQEIASEQRRLLEVAEPPPQTVEQWMTRLGVTSLDIKTWAHREGLITEVKRGRTAAHLVAAYAEHHRPTAEQCPAQPWERP